MNGHLLLDCSLHPHQTDAELVLHQLTDCSNPTIGQGIDVVNPTEVLVQPQQIGHKLSEIVDVENALTEIFIEPQLGVELEPADC